MKRHRKQIRLNPLTDVAANLKSVDIKALWSTIRQDGQVDVIEWLLPVGTFRGLLRVDTARDIGVGEHKSRLFLAVDDVVGREDIRVPRALVGLTLHAHIEAGPLSSSLPLSRLGTADISDDSDNRVEHVRVQRHLRPI